MMQFQEPITDETKEKIEELFGPGVPIDDFTALISQREIDGAKMKRIANLANQPVTVSMHREGEIKTLGDGTMYQVTPQGWRKLGDDNG